MASDTTAQDSDSGIWPDAAGKQDDDKMIPPYDGRTKAEGESESSKELRGTVERQMAETHGPGTGATTSPMEEQPVQPGEVTDEDPESALGVGVSTTRRGEDVKKEEGSEPGRTDLGPRGQSQRPSGTSDQRDSTGIDPQDLADPAMPNTMTGDGGG